MNPEFITTKEEFAARRRAHEELHPHLKGGHKLDTTPEIAQQIADQCRSEIQEKYLARYNIPMPVNVEESLQKAAKLTNIMHIHAACAMAESKAETHYYALWAKGEISPKAKQALEDHIASKEFIKKINRESNRAAMSAEEEAEASAAPPAPKEKKIKQPGAPKPEKLAIYEDKAAQEERLTKYPHAIAGTFKQAPSGGKGTVVDIKCVVCSKPRTIPVAELFHITKCKECKEKK